MGVVVKALGSKIRVFKWDINPPQVESLASAVQHLGGIFLIRLRLLATVSTQPEKGIHQDHEVYFPKTSLNNLNSFKTARKLIGAALKQLPDLDPCQNLAVLAGSLAADLLFRFRFGPEILSGQGPIPVIYVRLDVELQPEKPNLTENANLAAKKFPGSICEFIYLGSDARVKRIRRLCRECCYEGRSHDDIIKPPPGFEEVKADFEIKYFDEGVSDGDPEGQQCRICFETFSEGTMVVKTSCSYLFHKRCMYEWLLGSNSCPMCGSNCIVNV